MYASTLDYLFGISKEIGEKVSAYLDTGDSDEKTAELVGRLEGYEADGNEWWFSDDPNIIAYWQLHEPVLLMDFGTFHEHLEGFLGRGVMTHELGVAVDELRDEADAKRVELGYF